MDLQAYSWTQSCSGALRIFSHRDVTDLVLAAYVRLGPVTEQ